MIRPSDNAKIDENAITSSEARLRALVAASSDVIYSMSADWSEMRELDGRGILSDTDKPITDWMSKYIPEQERGRVQAAIDEAISLKKVFQVEHRVFRADASWGWTLSRAIPIFNEHGAITEWFGTAADITERKRAEQELRDAKEQSEHQKRVYETITGSTPDLIYVFDLDYRFTYANSALLTMWGKTWETAIGRNLLENGYEPWHAEMHEREIDEIKLTKQPIRGEVSFPHAILGKRVYDYILIPVLDEYGQVEAVAGTTRDVTERKQWEESLAQSSEQLQAMNEELAATNEEQAASNEELAATIEELAMVNQQLQTAHHKIEGAEESLRMAIDAGRLGTFYIGSSDQLFVTSARLKEFFGFLPKEEVSSEAALNQIHPDYRQEVFDMVKSAFARRSRLDIECPIIGHHDGKTRWVRAIGEMQHRDGNDYFTGVLHEITEKKQDEIRKNDFIGMVSHELKTPLTSMKGYIQVLLMKLRQQDDGFVIGALEKANAQVAKMTNMINGFLNVSRLESGKIHIDLKEFDLALLIKEAEEESLATITSHTVVFEPVETTLVNADRDKIGQVIHNLISNAVKYSPPGSTINVACISDLNKANVHVKDQGMGIKPDDLSKIFDRYYRVEGNQTSSVSGFGIGLYLCSEIIDRHHGKIWAESEVDKGSTFSFSLPLSQV
ncbi:PAS sensor signal transduction histidine kinase [Pedobacter sp. BAL39]|uniref:PAS domain S-box protein n=1 Tax=Pedobacter sp. BAL39 TaxID=391596 RepID=UPI00015598CE|nr:PAS domain S-box protein [Pedobacter sp. BAL39]EDM37737.1 PAS sensor signal transduction histidine kinase [Pedobacter sp. BAL39]